MNVDTSALDLTTPEKAPAQTPDTMQHQSFLRKWGGLVVLSLALAIIIIDTTLLNVSLRTIINDLHTDLKSMQWVITIYSLILAAFTITGGRLGDFFGRKRMFLAGAVIFAVGSLLASLSTNIGMMVAGEAIIEGLGAALMMPATASLLVTNFKGRDRSIAFGVWGGIAAASSAIGPILGGWLTTNYSWRWGFRINIFVVALVLAGAFLIKENHALRQKAKIDFIGILLSATGLLSLVFAFIQASTFGWFKTKAPLILFHHTLNLGSLSATPVFLALGVIILTAFVFWERAYEAKGKTPLLSLHLFRNSAFVSGASTMAVLALGQAGLFFAIPVFLQAVRHLDALHTGLTLLPMSIALLVAAPLSAFLNKYINPKRLIQAGLSLSILAFIVLRAGLNIDSTVWSLAPGFIIFGFGMGLIMAQVSNLTLSAVSPQEAGEASGVNNTLRMVGQTLGSAILGAILLSALLTNVTKGIQDSTAIPNQAKQGIEQNIADHVSSISFGAQQDNSSTVPKVIRDELATITNQATVDANKTVMVYGTIFIFLGLLVSTRLPSHAADHSTETPGTGEGSAEGSGEGEGAPSDDNLAEAEAEEAIAISPIAVAMAEAPENDHVVSKRTGRILVWGGIGVIAVLGIIFMSVWASNNDTKDSSYKPVVIEETAPNSNTNSENSAPVVTPQPVETPAPVAEPTPVVTPPTTTPAAPTPAPSVPPATTAAYTNSNLHFSFAKPSDWTVVKDSNGEVVFKAANGLYNVQSSSVSNGDMASLKTFLESRPNLHNVTLSKFGNRDAYWFNIDGSYQTGYAFLENGRLYYVLGASSEKTALGSLTIF
ncbi:MAG TPA: MFS transporter [Patescibacteria group bacterium]|nr:MFS transporter [Patescibacteria group bacterium]